MLFAVAAAVDPKGDVFLQKDSLQQNADPKVIIHEKVTLAGQWDETRFRASTMPVKLNRPSFKDFWLNFAKKKSTPISGNNLEFPGSPAKFCEHLIEK